MSIHGGVRRKDSGGSHLTAVALPGEPARKHIALSGRISRQRGKLSVLPCGHASAAGAAVGVKGDGKLPGIVGAGGIAVRRPMSIHGGVRRKDGGGGHFTAVALSGEPARKGIPGKDRIIVWQKRQPSVLLRHQNRAAGTSVCVKGNDTIARPRAAALNPVGVKPGISVKAVVKIQPRASGGAGVPAAENVVRTGAQGGVRPSVQPALQIGIPGLGNRIGVILVQREADDVAALLHPLSIEGLAAEESLLLPHQVAAAWPSAPSHKDISVPGGFGRPAVQSSLFVRCYGDRTAAAAVWIEGDVIGRGRVRGPMPIDVGIPGKNMVFTVLLAAGRVGKPAHNWAVNGIPGGPVAKHAVCAGDSIPDEVLNAAVITIINADNMGPVWRPQCVERGIPPQLTAGPNPIREIIFLCAPAPEHISLSDRLRRKLGNPSAGVRLYGARCDGRTAIGVKGDLVGDNRAKGIPDPVYEPIFAFQFISVGGKRFSLEFQR